MVTVGALVALRFAAGGLRLPGCLAFGAATRLQPAGAGLAAGFLALEPAKSVIFQSPPSLTSSVLTPLMALALSPLTWTSRTWMALMRWPLSSVIVWLTSRTSCSQSLALELGTSALRLLTSRL